MNINIKEIDSYLFQIIINNQIFFVVLFTIAVANLKNYAKKNLFTVALAHIVGTLFHELAHYIVALITTLKFPKWISIFPSSETVGNKKYITLGYVIVDTNNINTFNAALIGMAPLLLLALAYYVYIYFFTFYTIWFELNSFSYLLYIFLITTLIVNSIPSSPDFALAKQKGSLIFWLFILIPLYVYFKFYYTSEV